MRTIIEGTRYDTEKAELVGEANYGYAGDFSSWRAGLYRTPRSGRYFLAGKGGPMTRFSQRTPDGGSSGGKKIIPLTAEDALQWAEQHLPSSYVEVEFADKIEDA